MVNRGVIESIVFKNYKTKEETYGFIVRDDYAHVYYDYLDEDQLKLDNEEFLKLVYNTKTGNENQIIIEDIISFSIENGVGLEINGEIYNNIEVCKILGIDI